MDFLLCILLIAADQFTKYLAVLHLKGQPAIPIVRDVLELNYLENRGAAFGLPIPERCLSAASGAVLAMLWCDRRRSPIGAGLALGGGLSNLRERFRRGRVYDYVRFPRAPRPLNRYVFNLADFAILAGGLTLLMRRKRR